MRRYILFSGIKQHRYKALLMLFFFIHNIQILGLYLNKTSDKSFKSTNVDSMQLYFEIRKMFHIHITSNYFLKKNSETLIKSNFTVIVK